jgi:hypothetical protein
MWTQADLNALTAAIAQGAKKVKYSDKEVEYRSLAEMLQLRDLMQRELGLSKPVRLFAKHSKGLGSNTDI